MVIAFAVVVTCVVVVVPTSAVIGLVVVISIGLAEVVD